MSIKHSHLESETRSYNIVVPTDLSPDSECALRLAAEQARLRIGQNYNLTLLSVVENPFAAAFDLSLGSNREQVWVEAEATTRRQLEHLRDRLFDPVRTQCVVIRDHHPVDEEILRFARTHGADMIIIASHGRTGIAKTVFGNIADKIVRKSPCAVLVAPVDPGAK